MQVGAWQVSARQKIPGTPYGDSSDTPGLDLQVLLSHIIQQPRAWIIAHPEAKISAADHIALDKALIRLLNGEPLPYIIEQRFFMGLEFSISPSVLIPRPETEELVEIALHWLKANPNARKAIDIGTGSGCIATSIAHFMPSVSMIAIDTSWSALNVARHNFSKLQVSDRVQPICANLLDVFQTHFDLICANLPYIPTDQLKKLPVYRHEPTLALDGGPDGLSLIQALLENAPQYLSRNGLLLLETESGLGHETFQLARQSFPQADITLLEDLAHHPRIIKVENNAH
jgi:release factor glutamine methyltransferase